MFSVYFSFETKLHFITQNMLFGGHLSKTYISEPHRFRKSTNRTWQQENKASFVETLQQTVCLV